ncbi:hypothetical protein N7452_005380 [Penicillium brevicompactum]|uniref:Uncharacterized protein n=1 Tax=Penicillium brevicompactum TaxID=5074 RepID=A0A9W9QIM9_PENBR|nr:hypothetical protein N7452_005380 [Penicillium brevicompactum]
MSVFLPLAPPHPPPVRLSPSIRPLIAYFGHFWGEDASAPAAGSPELTTRRIGHYTLGGPHPSSAEGVTPGSPRDHCDVFASSLSHLEGSQGQHIPPFVLPPTKFLPEAAPSVQSEPCANNHIVFQSLLNQIEQLQ